MPILLLTKLINVLYTEVKHKICDLFSFFSQEYLVIIGGNSLMEKVCLLRFGVSQLI